MAHMDRFGNLLNHTRSVIQGLNHTYTHGKFSGYDLGKKFGYDSGSHRFGSLCHNIIWACLSAVDGLHFVFGPDRLMAIILQIVVV